MSVFREQGEKFVASYRDELQQQSESCHPVHWPLSDPLLAAGHRGGYGKVRGLAGDRTSVFLGGHDGSIRRISLSRLREQWSVQRDARVLCIANLSHEHIAVGLEDTSLEVIQKKTGECVKRIATGGLTISLAVRSGHAQEFAWCSPSSQRVGLITREREPSFIELEDAHPRSCFWCESKLCVLTLEGDLIVFHATGGRLEQRQKLPIETQTPFSPVFQGRVVTKQTFAAATLPDWPVQVFAITGGRPIWTHSGEDGVFGLAVAQPRHQDYPIVAIGDGAGYLWIYTHEGRLLSCQQLDGRIRSVSAVGGSEGLAVTHGDGLLSLFAIKHFCVNDQSDDVKQLVKAAVLTPFKQGVDKSSDPANWPLTAIDANQASTFPSHLGELQTTLRKSRVSSDSSGVIYKFLEESDIPKHLRLTVAGLLEDLRYHVSSAFRKKLSILSEKINKLPPPLVEIRLLSRAAEALQSEDYAEAIDLATQFREQPHHLPHSLGLWEPIHQLELPTTIVEIASGRRPEDCLAIELSDGAVYRIKSQDKDGAFDAESVETNDPVTRKGCMTTWRDRVFACSDNGNVVLAEASVNTARHINTGVMPISCAVLGNELFVTTVNGCILAYRNPQTRDGEFNSKRTVLQMEHEYPIWQIVGVDNGFCFNQQSTGIYFQSDVLGEPQRISESSPRLIYRVDVNGQQCVGFTSTDNKHITLIGLEDEKVSRLTLADDEITAVNHALIDERRTMILGFKGGRICVIDENGQLADLFTVNQETRDVGVVNLDGETIVVTANERYLTLWRYAAKNEFQRILKEAMTSTTLRMEAFDVDATMRVALDGYKTELNNLLEDAAEHVTYVCGVAGSGVDELMSYFVSGKRQVYAHAKYLVPERASQLSSLLKGFAEVICPRFPGIPQNVRNRAIHEGTKDRLDAVLAGIAKDSLVMPLFEVDCSQLPRDLHGTPMLRFLRLLPVWQREWKTKMRFVVTGRTFQQEQSEGVVRLPSQLTKRAALEITKELAKRNVVMLPSVVKRLEVLSELHYGSLGAALRLINADIGNIDTIDSQYVNTLREAIARAQQNVYWPKIWDHLTSKERVAMALAAKADQEKQHIQAQEIYYSTVLARHLLSLDELSDLFDLFATAKLLKRSRSGYRFYLRSLRDWIGSKGMHRVLFTGLSLDDIPLTFAEMIELDRELEESGQGVSTQDYMQIDKGTWDNIIQIAKSVVQLRESAEGDGKAFLRAILYHAGCIYSEEDLVTQESGVAYVLGAFSHRHATQDKILFIVVPGPAALSSAVQGALNGIYQRAKAVCRHENVHRSPGVVLFVMNESSEMLETWAPEVDPVLVPLEPLRDTVFSQQPSQRIRELIVSKEGAARWLNPYSWRGSVRNPDLIMPRESVSQQAAGAGRLIDLVGQIVNSRSSFQVVGSRRLGKTTLLRSVKRRIDAHENQYAVYVTMEKLKDSDDLSTKAYRELALALKSEALPAAVHPSDDTCTIREIASQLKSDESLVLLIDEVDCLVGEGSEDFIREMRGIADATDGKVRAVMAGWMELYRATMDGQHALANCGQPLQLSLLSNEAAKKLAEAPLLANGFDFAHQRIVQEIVDAGTAHPSFLQCYLHFLFNMAAHEDMVINSDLCRRVLRLEQFQNEVEETTLTIFAGVQLLLFASLLKERTPPTVEALNDIVRETVDIPSRELDSSLRLLRYAKAIDYRGGRVVSLFPSVFDESSIDNMLNIAKEDIAGGRS